MDITVTETMSPNQQQQKKKTNFHTHEVVVAIERICYDEEEGGHNCFLIVAMTQLHKL